ncbi:MAG TPA: alpha-L-rhamnosidase C-terminal domain-containing protein [Mucilaginibacter sp.]|nr:alpha-L-rhamnosidase C-terminal domain-containing protein [Mucilaginibacter sp.]
MNKVPKDKKIVLIAALLGLMLFGGEAKAQKASWIWYPGDYSIWLSNKMQTRRTERGTFLPPFWKLYSPYALMEFHKDFTLSSPEDAHLYIEGQYNVNLDGQVIHGVPKIIHLPAGKHRISLKVYNDTGVPAIYLKSAHLASDTSWLVTYEDKEWIDASGKTSDVSATKYLHAASWDFTDPAMLPSKYHLPVEPEKAAKIERKGHSLFVDFGKETFGYLKLNGMKGSGTVSVYYGESPYEARDTGRCELTDRAVIGKNHGADYTFKGSRAFRYVTIDYDDNISIGDVSMLYEYSPVKQRGSFRCSDKEINKIWDVAAYTLHLNTREFFIDGIKRDRWVWSGDAYQSYLMNYYLFFDSPEVVHTLQALRGKNPVTSHINTILDYTFYWFLGINDYYLYTGDKAFIDQNYQGMKSLMEFCLARRDQDGLVQGLPGDWVFIDWADGLSKQGEVSFEQVLFCRSLETMAQCARIAGDTAGAEKYEKLAAGLKEKIFKYYWNDQKHALVHSRINGKPTDNVTRYANMFAIFFNYLDQGQKQDVKKYVLLNKDVPGINTPYMRFYELEALCAIGEQDYVLKQIKDYWGGMLKLGATTFWEEYNPAKKGAENYAMYGRPYGKSLCHAWGASPIYLLGKYYLGVKPLSPGYEDYTVEPNLGTLKWIQGAVPTPHGRISVYCGTTQIKVSSDENSGTLRFKSKTKPECNLGEIAAKDNNVYELHLQKGKNYVINYSAISQ